jgi:hypothetical protein
LVSSCKQKLFTVTVNEQVGPAAGVQLTVVVPTGKNEPEAGEQVIGLQLASAVGLKFTVVPVLNGQAARGVNDRTINVSSLRGFGRTCRWSFYKHCTPLGRGVAA